MAHFEEPQIFVAQFIANLFHVPWPTSRGSHIFVAHFDYICDVMMTKLLGSASELMAVEVVSKNKVIASPVLRMAGLKVESELIYQGK